MSTLLKIALAGGAWLLLRPRKTETSEGMDGLGVPKSRTGYRLRLSPGRHGTITGINFSGPAGFVVESVVVNNVLYLGGGGMAASGVVPVRSTEVEGHEQIVVTLRRTDPRAMGVPRAALVWSGEKMRPTFDQFRRASRAGV